MAKKKDTRKIIVIDAGHGDWDSGAIDLKGNAEKDHNLLIASALKNKLPTGKYKVIMTRTGDTYSTPSSRGLVAVNNKAHLLFSIHHNASGDGQGKSSGYLYIPDHVTKFHNQSCALGKIIGAKMKSTLSLKNLGMYERIGSDGVHSYFSILSVSEDYLPGIITEALFLDNENDVATLYEDEYYDYYDVVSTIYADSINKWFADGKKYIPPKSGGGSASPPASGGGGLIDFDPNRKPDISKYGFYNFIKSEAVAVGLDPNTLGTLCSIESSGANLMPSNPSKAFGITQVSPSGAVYELWIDKTITLSSGESIYITDYVYRHNVAVQLYTSAVTFKQYQDSAYGGAMFADTMWNVGPAMLDWSISWLAQRGRPASDVAKMTIPELHEIMRLHNQSEEKFRNVEHWAEHFVMGAMFDGTQIPYQYSESTNSGWPGSYVPQQQGKVDEISAPEVVDVYNLAGTAYPDTDNLLINYFYKIPDNFGKVVVTAAEFNQLRKDFLNYYQDNKEGAIIKTHLSAFYKRFYGTTNADKNFKSTIKLNKVSADVTKVEPSSGKITFNFIDWPVMQKGSKNKYVIELQKALNALKLWKGKVSDYNESFGPITKKSVEAFQGKYKLKVDGKAGKDTKNKIISEIKKINTSGKYTIIEKKEDKTAGEVNATGKVFTGEYTIDEIQKDLNSIYSKSSDIVNKRVERLKDALKKADDYILKHYTKMN